MIIHQETDIFKNLREKQKPRRSCELFLADEHSTTNSVGIFNDMYI